MGQKPQVGGEFLTFFPDDDEDGFESLKVQEIIGMMRVTPVPFALGPRQWSKGTMEERHTG